MGRVCLQTVKAYVIMHIYAVSYTIMFTGQGFFILSLDPRVYGVL